MGAARLETPPAASARCPARLEQDHGRRDRGVQRPDPPRDRNRDQLVAGRGDPGAQARPSEPSASTARPTSRPRCRLARPPRRHRRSMPSRSFAPASQSARFLTLATDRCSTAPADALHAAGVTDAARRSGITTPAAPATSAARQIAPRLCGSSIWSSATTSASSASSREFRSAYGYGSTSATTPWWSGDPQSRSSFVGHGVGPARSGGRGGGPAPPRRPDAGRRSARGPARQLRRTSRAPPPRRVPPSPSPRAGREGRRPVEVLGLAPPRARRAVAGSRRRAPLPPRAGIESEQRQRSLRISRAPGRSRSSPSATISKRTANAWGVLKSSASASRNAWRFSTRKSRIPGGRVPE